MRRGQEQRSAGKAEAQQHFQEQIIAKELRAHEKRIMERRTILQREKQRGALNQEMRREKDHESALADERHYFQEKAAQLASKDAHLIEEDEQHFQRALFQLDEAG